MWYKSKYFKFGMYALLALLIIYYLGKVDFFLNPFKKFFTILFFPILISGVLYYLLRPLVRLFVKIRVPKPLAIVITFLLVITFFSLIVTYAGSIIGKQMDQLMNDLPGIVEASRIWVMDLISSEELQQMYRDKLEPQLGGFIQKAIPMVSESIFDFLSKVAEIATLSVMIPFILFYFLKDDGIFTSKFLKRVPDRYRSSISDIMDDMDKTLSTYMTGQATIALVLGIMMYIGYLIIGVKYSLILAIFAMLTCFIPLVGSFIGIIPALLISLPEGPWKLLWILVVMVVVQQLEGNLISPQLMGKRLDIHPLTLILLFLVSASLYGFVGMLIAVPTYAVIKVISSSASRIYKIWNSKPILK